MHDYERVVNLLSIIYENASFLKHHKKEKYGHKSAQGNLAYETNGVEITGAIQSSITS